MTQDGEVLRFDAERGFGFIGTADGQRHIFFHVRDWRGGVVPRAGERVRFERIEVGGKGPRAMAVQPLAGTGAGAARRPAANGRPAPQRSTHIPRPGAAPSSAARGLDGQPALFIAALLAWAGLLVALTWRQAWPAPTLAVLAGLACLNVATFMAYALDKRAARQGRWRTPENTLHALALLGGWPAAWLAQRALRHKSRKQPFLTTYALTVLLHLAALGALLWHAG